MENKYNTLREIQGGIERGDIANISRRTGYDLSHVYRVIKGESYANLEILNEASRILRNREKVSA